MSSKRYRESMKLEVAECLEHSLEQLRDIWDEIGIDDEQRVERQNVVMHHMRNLLNEMVAEENDLRRRLIASVENCGQEVVTIGQELGLKPFQPEEGLSILQLEKALRLKVESLSKEKSERMAQLKLLQDREQHLCDLLCTTPYYIPTGTVPTAEQLDTLRDHIKALIVEKDTRQNILRSTKKKIVSLLESLEQGPNTSFERDIVCEEEESFLLSKENMEALKFLHQELEFKESENEGVADHLREQITGLWNRLLFPADERDEYLANHQGHKPSDISELKDELARLEQLKLQNLKRVTLAIREEIAVWWERCYFSRQQKNSFVAFYDDEFTEEILQQHDEELARMKAYYETNEEILECVKKREEMWKKMIEFEAKANDPNRYNNRGGNLLQEEKERKKINRDLPKVEKNLAERISEFEKEKGEAFLVDGCRFMDYVEMQWAGHEQDKKLRKDERMKAKQVQTENEMTFGSRPTTPAKKRLNGNTPLKAPATKRLKGLNGTSYAPSPRLGITHSSIMASPSTSRRPPRACKATPASANKKTTPTDPPSASTSTYIPHVPFPSPGSIHRPPQKPLRRKKMASRVLRPTSGRSINRKALTDKNTNLSHAFSTSAISGGTHGMASNISLASASSYSDFAKEFDSKRKNNYQSASSSASSPTDLTSSRANLAHAHV